MFVVYIVIGLLVVVFAIASYLGSDGYLVRKGLEETKRVSVSELVEGQKAKVVGVVRVRDGRKLTAPLSGRECVFYEVVVAERVHNGKHSHWKERIHDVDQVDFDVDDGTGTVHVRTTNMKQIAAVDERQSSGFLDDATPELEAYLKRHGTGSEGILFNKSMRYREGIFAVGEHVAICGQVGMERGATDDSEDATKTPYLDAPPGETLLASDESRSTGEADE